MSDRTIETLLLDLLSQVGDVRTDMASLKTGVGHIVERQKDFADNISAIEHRLEEGSKRHTEFAHGFADLEAKLQVIEKVPSVLHDTKAKLDGMFAEDGFIARTTADVKELMDWKRDLSAKIVVASAIVGSACWMIWEVLKWGFPHPKDLIDRLFH